MTAPDIHVENHGENPVAQKLMEHASDELLIEVGIRYHIIFLCLIYDKYLAGHGSAVARNE